MPDLARLCRASGVPAGSAGQGRILRVALRPGNGAVIQRRGSEPLGYRAGTPPQGTSAQRAAEIQQVAALLGNTIETLRLRQRIVKNDKERKLTASLNTNSDGELLEKIKSGFALNGIDLPDGTTLQQAKAHGEFNRVVARTPRLALELRQLSEQAKMAAIKSHALNLGKDAQGNDALIDTDAVKKDTILLMQMQQFKLRFEGDAIKTTADGLTVLTLFRGDAAFARQANQPGGLARPVFEKQGKAPGVNNQYVQDDMGVFTRRYAFIEKNKYQLRELANTGRLEGRFPGDISTKDKRAYNDINPGLRKKVPDLPNTKKFTSAYQLAYVHQELGSGPQQRGLSATTTPKYNVFSNQGESFRTKEGARLQVDLARVPIGTSTVPQLINHYSHKARQQQGAVRTLKIQGDGHARTFDHYEWSVKKNREVFLREANFNTISQITIHGPAGEQPGALSQGQLATQIGMPDYRQGFVAGRGKQRLAGGESDLFKEGHRDGGNYMRGYEYGARSRRVSSRDMNDHVFPLSKKPEETRYIQGVWDGYWNRAWRSS